MKNMRTLQKRIAYQLQQGSLDAEVTGITCDSRKVQPQNVFVCIRGNRMDGHVYAEEAVERGAAVLVAERELEGIPEKVTVLVVKDSREALAQLSCAWEDDPAQHLVTIGVTGTKGKTTSSSPTTKRMVRSMEPTLAMGLSSGVKRCILLHSKITMCQAECRHRWPK